MSTSFDFAFAPLVGRAAPGSTSSASSTTTTTSTRGEIGRYQADYPGKLIIPGTEVTTYKGHYNNIGSSTFADFRGGPIYRWSPPGRSTKVAGRGRAGGAVRPDPGDRRLDADQPPDACIGGSVCRGCPWDYTDAETDYSKVDAIEVQNGAADFGQPPNAIPSPFTATAIAFYERALASGRPHRRGRLERRPQDRRATAR